VLDVTFVTVGASGVITVVAELSAGVESPPEFIATTLAFRNLPTSSEVKTYVEFVAPEMFEYVPPDVVALDHWYE
jgi:hypothetical protein